ncbi:MAG TPA: tRNA (adenosine(37)-N6)-dimethylallyltransferase MiaA [Burkholderiales bacterium]|nr:tRNA (adenosine(37)-N6)-dimethylallyltransferase MiaA [Burkholderiales bacterium]
MTRTAYALLGPTASGKSKLALELAARRPIELVSLDSALVYRGMDIGTAKPSITERSSVPHHLIDIVDPDHSYSTGRWRSDAIRAVMDILHRGKAPVLVGGTMLYYRALVAGLDTLPQADAAIRGAIDADARQRGWPALHAELEKVDPRAAHRISANDSQRIQRALEVWRLTGKPLSALQGAAQSHLPFQLKGFALLPEREALHERIARRFDAMLQAGLVNEVKGLRARYRLTAGMPSMRAVGYRQVWQYLENEINETEMRERAIAATRQLAKRQLTWLRSFPDLIRLDAGGPQDAPVTLDLLLDEVA